MSKWTNYNIEVSDNRRTEQYWCEAYTKDEAVGEAVENFFYEHGKFERDVDIKVLDWEQ